MKNKAYMRKLEAQQLLIQKYDEFLKKSLSPLRCPDCSGHACTFHATYRRHLYKTRESIIVIEVL